VLWVNKRPSKRRNLSSSYRQKGVISDKWQNVLITYNKSIIKNIRQLSYKLLIKAYKALQGSGHNIWYRGKRRESGREKDLNLVENRWDSEKGKTCSAAKIKH